MQKNASSKEDIKKRIKSIFLYLGLIFVFFFYLIAFLYASIAFFYPQLLASVGILVPTNAGSTTIEMLKSATETVAVVVAGFWTYERFIKTKEETREEYPYPKIQHRIEHYSVRNGLVYLSVFVTVTNEGKRKLDLRAGKIYIRQVSPLPEKILKRIVTLIKENRNQDIQNGHDPNLFVDSGQRLKLDTLGDRKWEDLREKMLELEPGQTREIQFNFLIGSSIEVVEAISYFEYEKSGWELATLYSLKAQDTKAATSKKLKPVSQGIKPTQPIRQ